MSASGHLPSPSANILGLYHFFSRLLPGITLIAGASLLFPASVLLPLATSPAALLVIFVGFAAGQFVHSLVVFVEADLLRFTKTHRDYFHDFLESEFEGDGGNGAEDDGGNGADPDGGDGAEDDGGDGAEDDGEDEAEPDGGRETEPDDRDAEAETDGVAAAGEDGDVVVAGEDGDVVVAGEDGGVAAGGTGSGVVAARFVEAFEDVYGIDADELDTDTIYTIIRSRIEIDRRGRTAQYQMMRSFSRSMMGAIGVTLVLALGAYLAETLFPAEAHRPVIATLSPPVFGLFVLGSLVSIGVFQFGNVFYKRIYAKYLIVDFINVVDME